MFHLQFTNGSFPIVQNSNPKRAILWLFSYQSAAKVELNELRIDAAGGKKVKTADQSAAASIHLN